MLVAVVVPPVVTNETSGVPDALELARTLLT